MCVSVCAGVYVCGHALSKRKIVNPGEKEQVVKNKKKVVAKRKWDLNKKNTMTF